MKLSAGAQKICNILQTYKKDFSIEKSFPNLNSFKGKKLRFDFCVYNLNGDIDFLIEFDGAGHFQDIKHFYKTNKKFDNAKGRDRLKNNYCLAHRIPLYRIPYWEINNINTLKDILQSKFLVTSQYHNDRLTPK